MEKGMIPKLCQFTHALCLNMQQWTLAVTQMLSLTATGEAGKVVKALLSVVHSSSSKTK